MPEPASPPLLPPSLLPAIVFIISSLFTCVLVDAHLLCTTSNPEISSTRSPCAPFISTPPFPFSFSAGCGHPSFQLQCVSSHSVISVNNFSFALVQFEPNSSSLRLSPQVPSSFRTNCTYLSIPSRSIDLSSTPFRVSDSYCSRLSVLRSCSPLNLPNCSHCSWECKLIKNPIQLLNGCGSTRSPLSEQGCQSDVLEYLDNFLRIGFQVEYDESQDSYFSNCSDCKSNNGVCGYNSSDPDKHFICFQSKTRISPLWIRHDDADRIAILCAIFTVLCLLLVVLVVAAIFRSRKLRLLAVEEDPTTIFLRRHRSASLLPPVFSYEELESSTNRFDPKRKIGDGGFGSVFLGHLYDGRLAAVKYLHNKHHHQAATESRAFSTKSFCNEILILSSINHPNLVKLHGYCSDPRGLLLVYDYVPNGTLADHLHGPKGSSLSWQVRLEIALQTALAIEYLHFSVRPAIVHRDITSANIFVEKDMRIKVGDFGLSRLLVFPETSSDLSGYVWTGPQGTPGYLDPDYHRSFRLTEKSDVYSFGVVLMELISGLKAVDQSRGKMEMALADLVVSKIQMGQLRQVVDLVLAGDGEAMDGVEAMAELAFRCVAADKDDRPDSKEVVEELKRIRARSISGPQVE